MISSSSPPEESLHIPRSKGRPTKEMQARKRPSNKSSEVIDMGSVDYYASQAEAAGIRGVSKQAIADLNKRGRTTITVAGRKPVLRSEVESFQALPMLGRPLKKPEARKPSNSTQNKK